jgi:hypothetical protein
MKRCLAFLPALLAVVGCSSSERAAQPASSPAAPAGAVSIFNGKDLTGWVQVLDSKWTVENGVLLARQDPKGRREGESWLFTEKDYTDFVLTLQFRVTPGGNSGVFLRDPLSRKERLAAADGGPKPWESGLEAQICADDEEWSTGGIVFVQKAPKGLEKPGEWNEMKVKVQGDHVQTWVNGKPAAEGTQTKTTRGAIGFQRHGTPKFADKLVEIKEVFVSEL